MPFSYRKLIKNSKKTGIINAAAAINVILSLDVCMAGKYSKILFHAPCAALAVEQRPQRPSSSIPRKEHSKLIETLVSLMGLNKGKGFLSQTHDLHHFPLIPSALF
jgi:hypothetical protein